MVHPDLQYQGILREILENGIWQSNRTQFKAKFIPSATIVHDLRNGFPALTTKQLFFKQSIGENIAFIHGAESAKDFRDLGCRFWDSDANKNKTWLASPFRKGEDDLGKVYGSTWRSRETFVSVKTAEERAYYQDNGYSFIGYEHDRIVLSKHVDQLKECVDKIINNPQDRRNILHAWFPELFPQMALPPCHVMYEFVPDEQNKILHMTMTQRSCDTILGVPMNLFGASLILQIIANATGYTAGVFSHHMTNVHLYENQIDVAKIQLDRVPYVLPSIHIEKSVTENPDLKQAIHYIETLETEDVSIIGYIHHDKLEHVSMAQEI